MAHNGDGFSNKNFTGNTEGFSLLGGRYAATGIATGTGTLGLEAVGPDGTTWVPVFTAWTATANYAIIELPPGTYRWASATFTAIYASVVAIPS